MDRWTKIIQTDGFLKATAISATDLVSEAAKRHKYGKNSQREIIALGESLIASLLLASRRKQTERVSLAVRGDGFLQKAIVDATPSGTCRGFLITRESHRAPLPQEEALNREFGIGPWGEGSLSVVTLIEGEKEPYTGTCQLVTGHLAKDVTFYMTQSEQIPSAVGLAVNCTEDGTVLCAGGFLIEVMPGASEDDIGLIEQNLKELQGLPQALSENSDPVHFLARIFNGKPFSILENRPILFQCNCSRDRVRRALSLIARADLEQMIEDDDGAKVDCDFCGKHYVFNSAQLKELLP